MVEKIKCYWIDRDSFWQISEWVISLLSHASRTCGRYAISLRRADEVCTGSSTELLDVSNILVESGPSSLIQAERYWTEIEYLLD